MAEIKINTEGMRSAANDFNSKNDEWNSLVNQIWAYLQELDEMWDGDANDAFNALVEEDKPKFEALYQRMIEYKEAINKAAEHYETSEEEIKIVVTKR